MKVAASALIPIAALAASACASPSLRTAELPCAGVRQTAECIEARRQSELGLTPRSHQMTARERGELSSQRLERELDYARSRPGGVPR
ncbi:MAG: hypothetical protein H2038_05695 [Brevundimonas sp.]|uniref:hypothetical protein n=1 Tax=Brevundimonas sp. TaxID=1871086 RepID=UPI0017934C75|nr:hypothetical protein [Brevundimonas sp.]MBA4804126.1 hypothetical protein [Brevundimonas sp.]